MAANNADKFAELFGTDGDNDDGLVVSNSPDGIMALSMDTLGITASEARNLNKLRETDPEAYEERMQHHRDKYTENKNRLKTRKYTEKTYSQAAKDKLDEQEKTPVDGACAASGQLTAPDTLRGFLES